jgi:hypothetical protein
MKRIYSIENGKKGGRPATEKCINKFIIPSINTVILTEYQYNTLIEKYGILLIEKALRILDDWLSTSPIGIKHKGKNHYALFRSDGWLLNIAKLCLKQQT